MAAISKFGFTLSSIGWIFSQGLDVVPALLRQSANLVTVKNLLQQIISKELTQDKELFLFDGFPIPTCHIKRYRRSKTNLSIDGGIGYCAAKDERYFGFKGHILIIQEGITKSVDIAPANIDERDVLPELTNNVQGDIIADKGLIRLELKEGLMDKGINLHTPLSSNMHDNRPKEFVTRIMDIRRVVETMIGQLVGRFKINLLGLRIYGIYQQRWDKKYWHTLSVLLL